MNRRSLLAMLAGGALSFAVRAQSNPDAPVKIVIPYPPGGGSDVLARPLAPMLAKQLQRSVIIDNRSGAAGNIGTAAVARSAADGTTLLLANNSQVINASLYPDPGYGVADFVPVALLATTAIVLVVPAALPARSVEELVELAKKGPNGLNIGNSGTGTPGHLSAVLFGDRAGIPLVHVPYRGSGPVTIAVMSNEVQLSFLTAASVEPHIRSGALRALAVASAERSPSFPDVPTMKETGISQLDDFEIDVWYGLWAPAGTAANVLDNLHAAVNDSLRDASLRQTWDTNALVPQATSRDAFEALLAAEAGRWSEVISKNGITVN